METFLIQSRRCCLRNTRWCAAQAAFFEREGGLVFGYEIKHEMWRRQQCKKCKCGPENVLRFHPKINTCIIHQTSTHINPGAGLI